MRAVLSYITLIRLRETKNGKELKNIWRMVKDNKIYRDEDNVKEKTDFTFAISSFLNYMKKDFEHGEHEQKSILVIGSDDEQLSASVMGVAEANSFAVWQAMEADDNIANVIMAGVMAYLKERQGKENVGNE
jgi:F0F1-type ATP synthase gamma subunit